jgi:hypothetical protein
VKLSIILFTLFSTFATDSSPDLCDDVFLDASGNPLTDLVGQTLSRFCKWTGPDAPVWDADVCCTFADDAAKCSATDTRGRCPSGTAKRYCEHGSLGADGRVTCYQPFPDACEAGWCIEAPELIPEAQMAPMVLCCGGGGACQYVHLDQVDDFQGELLACFYAIQHEGWVECLEDE